ncbi:MAG: AAA family ATPase [Flavobacterium sp.]|nr:AAA family ATPase [Flavobacterium sp.]
MSYQQLRSIHVKGYKSIKDQVILLHSMNVLIGQNGAGKTNFISLFRFLRNIIDGRLRIYCQKYGAESLLYYGSKETDRIYINLDFEPNYYEIELQPSLNTDILFISSEHSGYWGNKFYNTPYWETIMSIEGESGLSKKALSNRIADYVYNVLKAWRVYHFHDTSESAGVKKYASITDYAMLFEDASNLATFLYWLKQTSEKHYERIVKTIQLVIPFFSDFVLRPKFDDAEKIRIEWQDIYSDKTFTANDLSDGSLRFICMAVLLLQPHLPKVILLDEPELGLHPSAITILAGLLKKASHRSQVIVSTQSVSLVNEFNAEDIIVVDKKNAETVFNRLDSEHLESWLNEYSLGDLWDKNIIGGKP